MKISELIDALERCRDDHGDVYVSIRHTARHQFSPSDDLMEIRPEYDGRSNLLVIHTEN